MKRIIEAVMITAIAFSMAYCNSAMKVGTEKSIEKNGKKIGTQKRMSETEMLYTYDTDTNGVNEKSVFTMTDKDLKNPVVIKKVEFDKDQDKVQEKVIMYQNGKPYKVFLYNKDNQVTDEIMINDKKLATSVTVVDKKKVVRLNTDGTVDKIEDTTK